MQLMISIMEDQPHQNETADDTADDTADSQTADEMTVLLKV